MGISGLALTFPLMNITVNGMRINLLLFPIVGFQMVTTTFFQSIGKAKISILLSLTRQAIFLIPALLILQHKKTEKEFLCILLACYSGIYIVLLRRYAG